MMISDLETNFILRFNDYTASNDSDKYSYDPCVAFKKEGACTDVLVSVQYCNFYELAVYFNVTSFVTKYIAWHGSLDKTCRLAY